eukprot:2221072-Prymnesium_polylepis.1
MAERQRQAHRAGRPHDRCEEGRARWRAEARERARRDHRRCQPGGRRDVHAPQAVGAGHG